MKSPGRLTAMPSQIVRQRQADPAREPAASQRHHHQLHVRRLAGDLEPDRPLARHHVRLVERVDDRIALRLGQPVRSRLGLVVAAVDEAHLAAVLLHGRDLRQRRLLGHHQHRPRARLARRERHRLRMVARTRSDHAAGQLLPRQPPDHVRGAARLERAGELKILCLQHHARPHSPGQLARREHRRLPHSARQRAGSALDVGEGDGFFWSNGHVKWDYALMSTVDETVRLLAGTEVFGEVEQRELAEVAQVAVPRSWDRGQVIFREGDVGDTCYLLRTGAVVLTREHPDGRTVALAELRAGMLFGELAMFRGERRSATAEVVEPASAVALLATDVQRLIRRNPDLALKLLASLSERVSRTNERLLQQSFQTVAGRVASALLAQTVNRQADGAPDSDVLIRSTQAEIAHLAGTSRESASRFLATLERAGIVTLGRGKVTVHDPSRLRNYIH